MIVVSKSKSEAILERGERLIAIGHRIQDVVDLRRTLRRMRRENRKVNHQ